MTDPRLRTHEQVHAPKAPTKRAPRGVIPELRAFLRQQLCILASVNQCRGAVEVSHVRSRGAGGGDYDNTVPMCQKHHREMHRVGRKSWEFKYQYRLAPVARLLTALFLKTYPEMRRHEPEGAA